MPAPGTTPPDGSVTVPVKAPVEADCDHVEGTNPNAPTVKKAPTIIQTTQFGFMSSLLVGFLARVHCILNSEFQLCGEAIIEETQCQDLF